MALSGKERVARFRHRERRGQYSYRCTLDEGFLFCLVDLGLIDEASLGDRAQVELAVLQFSERYARGDLPAPKGIAKFS